MAFDTLNRLKWTGKLGGAEIVIRHRGAPLERRVIAGPKVTRIKRSHFYYEDGGRERFIPLHRVLLIRLEGKTIWKRSTGRG
ncbi:MAG: DUF504 domain-containing protein [Candidatus Aenigmarchaeota archaeon]|nr:DUF504 domain-containing protein [Candidatus Aenigmarchaeota archaeon]